MPRSSLFYVLSSLLIFAPQSVFAQTATSPFTVQMTITADCQITSAGNLSFGSAGLISSNRDATSTLTVQCTNGTAYNLGLNEGAGTGATVTSRLMTGPASATIGYALYRDTARSTVWGNTVGTNTVSASGTGSTQTYTVYGRVASQTTPAAGAYTDTVTVTVTY
ncbi:fimbrial major subunit CsuA/B family protein [Agrobacterium vitis]|uniref:Fimbrial major subunit CsuA/B family protein n=1 Tax=Agrobacterium vitis TaxID=373 RepID=A0ABD6GFV4_AGRVI|nr:spore coat U domain-containing protein [Agrobacterium vitis]MUO80754.1 fimbrial major subunit CsuA/B family protein [Agrobacterium vitis]MUO97983.1 fimbrial major subunit CsuA/B family protein [Agrobacterium vitis]MUP05576.1 fimbrial major subunit CsuA/B family protein [Agrobacterium vitis]MUZ81430.1 fimbrial major subunit CsuA/B family protein [Agrobacterium vitis]MVA95421.1 fimbrial major subunit CsuA/B family protein [Agrobacterium vitis]